MLVVGTVPAVGTDHASVRPYLVPHRSVADLSLPPASGGPADPLLFDQVGSGGSDLSARDGVPAAEAAPERIGALVRVAPSPRAGSRVRPGRCGRAPG
ncbi:hypothetical protein TPA0906_63870 [Streptomyces olivaceus]|nr:hypothetical protein BC342_04325 [Streptomyces olivaceus]GHJ04522.1 hypothetical protein TPA0906_63870 [Streptomyces olivaceus]